MILADKENQYSYAYKILSKTLKQTKAGPRELLF